ncbi:hypothetical protein SEMRO_1956_G307750.1 [Seminavis robusta]|uniref:Uncharacterized protein n=1 Tax=Seminavis robusta TaxID=568900 RepID=A0A9N8HWD4_9STRA|nr:hypothetical protein SEMRO_1956_G307750.1 [Seminavis robusta]|eukprot:Sro1956_g307750.1 n/a (279) ;mRNA; f:7822-8658
MRTRDDSALDEAATPAARTGRIRRISERNRNRSKSSPPVSQVGVPLAREPGHEEDSSDGTAYEESDKDDVSSLDDTSSDEKGSTATPVIPGSGSVPGSGNVRNKNPLCTNKRGLALGIQQTLADAIESRGGRDAFFDAGANKATPGRYQPLFDICEQNTDTYGVSGSHRREQVRSKCRWWHSLSLEEYQKVIKSLGVAPACERESLQLPATGSKSASKTKSKSASKSSKASAQSSSKKQKKTPVAAGKSQSKRSTRSKKEVPPVPAPTPAAPADFTNY